MWKTINRFVTIQSKWVTIFGENVLDSEDNQLEYWRVEKDDSVIIFPLHKKTIILPRQCYRHGIHAMTFDFPGGRNPKEADPKETAFVIVERELRIKPSFIHSMCALNTEGWLINSSFSNQKLFGFVTEIAESYEFPNETQIQRFPADSEGVSKLLAKVSCLQCRTILLEWFFQMNHH